MLLKKFKKAAKNTPEGLAAKAIQKAAKRQQAKKQAVDPDRGLNASQLATVREKAHEKMKRYVSKHGIKPGDTPDKAAAQVFMIQEAKKAEIKETEKERLKDEGYTPEQIEAELPTDEELDVELDLQEDEEASFTGEYDNFIDPITGAAALKTGKIITDKIGKSGVGKAVGKVGKKIFGSSKGKKSKDNPTPFPDNTIAAQAAMAAYQKKVETVKKAEIKKNLPLIVGVVFAIIAITAGVVYYSNNKGK